MSNIRSLDDLLGRGGDDDRKHNDYYAGGEKSGQLIRGAPEDDEEEDEDEDQVGSIFKQAKQFGAVNGTAEDLQQPSSAFRGVGRTLDGTVSQQGAQNEAPVHQVTFYRNGIFTVDDGPARQVTDPENYAFINSISKGECPRELDPGTSAIPVTVNLIRKEEDYVPPRAPVTFTGQGRTLGSSSGASSSAAVAATSRPPASREWAGVDESKPTTSLQLRLHDGSRLVARFNHSNTIADVRSFILTARADMPAAFTLATAFPPKNLEDDSVTLEAAGLLNAVLIQKL